MYDYILAQWNDFISGHAMCDIICRTKLVNCFIFVDFYEEFSEFYGISNR